MYWYVLYKDNYSEMFCHKNIMHVKGIFYFESKKIITIFLVNICFNVQNIPK